MNKMTLSVRDTHKNQVSASCFPPVPGLTVHYLLSTKPQTDALVSTVGLNIMDVLFCFFFGEEIHLLKPVC